MFFPSTPEAPVLGSPVLERRWAYYIKPAKGRWTSNGLEHLSYDERLRGLEVFGLKKRRFSRELPLVLEAFFCCLFVGIWCCFFCFTVRKVKQNRLPREAAETPALEGFKTQQTPAWGKPLQLTLLWARGLGTSFRGLCQ